VCVYERKSVTGREMGREMSREKEKGGVGGRGDRRGGERENDFVSRTNTRNIDVWRTGACVRAVHACLDCEPPHAS